MCADLRGYVEEAHDDARKRLRLGFEDELSPFEEQGADPAANYPAILHRYTLQGYFGETLSALAVEHWGAHGKTDWVVPALLFRFHRAEFQHLDMISQRMAAGEPHDSDAQREQRPGRTGDDCLAFRIDARHVITDVMALEAKCLGGHRAEELRSAHKKLAATPQRPPGVHELVELLRDYSTPEAAAWVEALVRLWQSGYAGVNRSDGLAYACGDTPRAPGRETWMNAAEPDGAYTLSRELEAMEFHFDNLDSLIDCLYRAK